MSVTFNASTTSGIGITSDNSGDIQFQSNAANTVIINSSGQVGIGTVSPASIFNVYSSSFASALIQGDAATNVTVNRSSTDASGPALNLRKARGTTSAQTAVASGDALGSLVFQAYGGTNNRSVSFVQGFVDTYTSDTNISSYLTFSTSPSGSASGTERMRIDSSGNVGIGTSSPSVKLQVRNTTASQVYVTEDTTGITAQVSASANGAIYGSFTNDPTQIRTNNIERMRIDTSGNVGIGTTGTLVEALEVQRTTDPKIRFIDTGNTDAKIGIVNSTALGFEVNSAERMRIDSSGYVYINETATQGTASYLTITAAASTVYGATIKDSGTTYATTTRYMNFVNSTNAVAGSIQHTAATTTAFSTSSDARLKKNIVDAPSAIDIIANIPVRSYDWKEDNSHVKFGFVAQELEQVYAEPVGVGSDDVNANPWSIEYGRMTPILVKALQELKSEFDAYKATHP